MYGEPNGRLAFRRPRYTMGTMSGDQDIATRSKLAFAFSLDAPWKDLPERAHQAVLYGIEPKKVTLTSPPDAKVRLLKVWL